MIWSQMRARPSSFRTETPWKEQMLSECYLLPITVQTEQQILLEHSWLGAEVHADVQVVVPILQSVWWDHPQEPGWPGRTPHQGWHWSSSPGLPGQGTTPHTIGSNQQCFIFVLSPTSCKVEAALKVNMPFWWGSTLLTPFLGQLYFTTRCTSLLVSTVWQLWLKCWRILLWC